MLGGLLQHGRSPQWELLVGEPAGPPPSQMAQCTPACCAASQHHFTAFFAPCKPVGDRHQEQDDDARHTLPRRCALRVLRCHAGARLGGGQLWRACRRAVRCRSWQGKSLTCSSTGQASTLMLPRPAQAARCTRLPRMASLLLLMTIVLLPAGFLNSVATFIPAVAGVDLESLVKQARRGCLLPSLLLFLPPCQCFAPSGQQPALGSWLSTWHGACPRAA